MEIAVESPRRPDIEALLTEHLADMYATSPACSVHALDLDALDNPSIRFVTARVDGALIGCGALKDLGEGHGELKSMRTRAEARGTGVATGVLAHLIGLARTSGMTRVSLETGTQDFFAPARALYAKHGFVECDPFGDYELDPNSHYMTRTL